MLLESLARLAQIQELCKESGIVISSDSFMKETDEIIEMQRKVVVSELSSRDKHPGPHSFGFGELVVTIYTPENTGDTYWAIVIDKGEERKVYVANGISTLVEALVDGFSTFTDMLSSDNELQNKAESTD